VEESLRNMKIADQMATTALGYARENGFRVVATCQYMASFLKRHAEYQDLM
jgi:predicted GNAT family acetyltransferase